MDKLVKEALDEVGIIIPSELFEGSDDFDLKDYIQDSLEFISVILKIEEKLGIEIPEEILSFDEITSFHGFCEALSAIENE
ncbi:phosphopantetheine-binding protein [Anaeromicropila populeti]|uniref:Phosphopantetheine attachment site n=1 Tax=Anaeromicropila populeti TaxID=37658 RepID=A0A1I6IN18_9FIRM|nr:phosphopantetheine-binding protein [Anaeromicropila populeti]SFR68157.1 Phosphopantetheine attachment site [Anaeromicropila populeti]